MDPQKREELLRHINDEDFKRWLQDQLKGEEGTSETTPPIEALPPLSFPRRFLLALVGMLVGLVAYWVVRWGLALILPIPLPRCFTSDFPFVSPDFWGLGIFLFFMGWRER
jgi:hypothetical protein